MNTIYDSHSPHTIKDTWGDTTKKNSFIYIKEIIYKVHNNTTTCIIKAKYGNSDLIRMCRINIKPLTFVGVAKCSDKDTFNENIGKDIAEHRAMIKLYSENVNIFNKMATVFANNLKGSLAYMDWAKDKINIQKDAINKLANK